MPWPDRRCRAMRRMFSSVSDMYARWWGEYFHFALYDQPELPRAEAFRRTHAGYFAALRVSEARCCLEVACGRGAFSALLAEQCPGQVLGVDCSPAQLAAARRAGAGRPNLSFRLLDAHRIGELGGGFDAIVCLDAACYFRRRPAVVRAMAAALRPGGRMLLVDWCRAERVTPLEDELLLRPFQRCWGIVRLATAEEYRRACAAAGLSLIACDDLNDRAAPNWRHGYTAALDALHQLSPADAAAMIGVPASLAAAPVRRLAARFAPPVRRAVDQFAAALYIQAGFDAGLLRYTEVLAERPAA